MQTTTPLEGACHCGAVRFQVLLDRAAGTVRCNCRYCTKTGWWGAMLLARDFTLIAGEDALGAPAADAWDDRRPCATCGVIPFARGHSEAAGGDFVVANVRCLDPASLDGVVVRHLDGRRDTWAEVAVTRCHDPFAAP